jgi:signal peptide peptidase SppA
MSFERLGRLIYGEPALITAAAHHNIRRIFEARTQGIPVDEMFQPAPAEPAYYMADSVAVISVKGVISREISMMEKTSGACDCDSLMATIEAVKADPQASAVVVKINSPGGGVSGVPECAAALATIGKPTIAHISEMGASGGYWLAAGCDYIYCEPSSNVGSIGVYSYALDTSEAYKAAGVRPVLTVSEQSAFKAIGAPGMPITDEQVSHLQERVNYIRTMFKSFVEARRPQVDVDALQAAVFIGHSAKKMGLVDSIASLQKAISDAGKLGKRKTT